MLTLPRDRVILTAALTGAVADKTMNPGVPEQPDEIIAAAVECYEAGAAIVHVHARDRENKPTGDRAIYEEILAGIRARCDIVVQFSTGGGGNLTLEQRLELP